MKNTYEETKMEILALDFADIATLSGEEFSLDSLELDSIDLKDQDKD